jgi:CP family cyanate transporter-like MFS transporter
LAAILLVAVNLRPVIGSVPPVAEQLAVALRLNAVGTGVLTTLPVLCMAVFAPIAAPLAGRFGERRLLIAAVALIGVGAGARAVPGVGYLYAGTAVAGTGIAICGTLLPAQVRRHAPDRVGPVTGLYTLLLIGGALVGSGATEPVRAALGASAQGVLAVWALPALAAVVFWLAAHGIGESTVEFQAVVGPPWHSGPAWRASLFMGAQSLLYYATLAWLAARYTDLGYRADTAGLLLAVFTAAQMVTALAMPSLAQRSSGPSGWIAASVGLTALGLLLVAVAPLAAPWVWVSMVGLGMGGNLALALTVITHAAPDASAATAYTGMAFLVGYLLAALGPVVTGWLRDATGSLTLVFFSLAGLGVVTIGIGLAAVRRPVSAAAANPAAAGPSPDRP